MTTREVEWDDFERERMLALGIYEGGVCACGFHKSLTSDRDNYFTIETDVCNVCKGAEQFVRQQADLDNRATRDDASPAEPRPGDGRKTFVRRMSPTEVEDRRAKKRHPLR